MVICSLVYSPCISIKDDDHGDDDDDKDDDGEF